MVTSAEHQSADGRVRRKRGFAYDGRGRAMADGDPSCAPDSAVSFQKGSCSRRQWG